MIGPACPTPAKAVFSAAAARLQQEEFLPELSDRWPAPVANEMVQLIGMLEAGVDAGGILMQVRDVAEVLLKTTTLLAAADLIRHGRPEDAVLARVALFSRRLLLGHWIKALRDFSAVEGAGFMVPELLALGSPGGTFMIAIDAYADYRNSDVGHGAYRPDSVELAERVRDQLFGKRGDGGLVKAFDAVATTGVWRACSLHADAPDGPSFCGHSVVRGLRPHAHGPDAHRHLYLVRNERSLDLSPFITGRICKECGFRDAFLFDSAKGWKPPKDDPRFGFIDYAHGHRLSVDASKTEPALVSLADLPLADLAFESHEVAARGEFASKHLLPLLDDIMFDSRFVSPAWLRTPLRDHMLARERGILWLQAPAHVGKSMFVRGLFGEGLESDKKKAFERALLGDRVRLDVAPVLFKREYRVTAAQFASTLENIVRSALRIDTSHRGLIIPDRGTSAELQAGFVEFLRRAMKARSDYGAARLLVALDGLDELRSPEGESPVSVLDYIPPADALPKGVTILLTSRAPADCPTWIRHKLTHDFAPGHQVHRAGIGDVGYLGLLREYVAANLDVPPMSPDFEPMFQAILKRSESLFLIVSFLCDLIRDGASIAPVNTPG